MGEFWLIVTVPVATLLTVGFGALFTNPDIQLAYSMLTTIATVSSIILILLTVITVLGMIIIVR